MGVSYSLSLNLSNRDISDFAKISVISLESHSYFGGVTAAQPQWHLWDMDMAIDHKCFDYNEKMGEWWDVYMLQTPPPLTRPSTHQQRMSILNVAAKHTAERPDIRLLPGTQPITTATFCTNKTILMPNRGKSRKVNKNLGAFSIWRPSFYGSNSI